MIRLSDNPETAVPGEIYITGTGTKFQAIAYIHDDCTKCVAYKNSILCRSLPDCAQENVYFLDVSEVAF